MEGNQPSVSTLLNDFPGINFVRLAIYDFASPATLTAYVNQLTSAGIVVELEDHSNSNGSNAGGASGTIFTGQQLTTELNWYSSIASAFANNPYVWFGTNNEPSETDASGNQNPAALSTWQQQTYDAIRGAGNTSPVMVEINGGNTPSSFAQGYTPSVYAGMTNIIGDIHYYGWVTGYSTDQATVSGNLAADIAQTQQTISSADGTLPIIIGEYGNSTTGSGIDPNANQVIAAVQQSGYGSVAWAWGQGGPDDGLTASDGTSLSAYGQQIAAGIAAAAASAASAPATPVASATPPTVVSTPATAAPTPSANDTVLAAGASDSITDASGNTWTIANGVAEINGQAAGYSSGVAELAYVNGSVWQENGTNLWWQWTGTGWDANGGTATSPLPTATVAAPAPTPAATASVNDSTVLSGSPGTIVDASGNTWSITGAGQVAVNGVTDTTTGNVTELAYVNNEVWQENANNLWWGKTSPTASWAPQAGTGSSPLPAPIALSAGTAGNTVSQSEVSVVATSGDNMLFLSGSGDIVNLSGGSNTITDTGQGNTYILPTAGNGTDTFTSNILATGDTLDLKAALAATDWNGASSTLANYVTLADSANGTVLSVAPTSGGTGVAITTIAGTSNATLSGWLSHLIT
nr:cellulase family glycosylhydrolase [uncultured Rhodopila sp.]